MGRLTTLRPSIQTAPGRLSTLARATESQRLRGRAAVDRRARYLRLHPLCVECKALGMTTAAEELDHRTPLWQGGADDESNFQGLCITHHREKTAAEAAERARGG